MKALLDELLPRLFPSLTYLAIPHDGKSDLRKSLPRKLRGGWPPGVRFLVLHDQDSADCHALKADLLALCHQAGQTDAVVRIVCRELEAWYLADPQAVAHAFDAPGFVAQMNAARFRTPDHVQNAALALEKRVPGYEKRSGSGLMGRHLDPRRSRSRSFAVFLEAISRIAGAPPLYQLT